VGCYAGHGRCPTRFRLLLFSLLILFPFPLSTLFFSLLCVASRHTKTAVTSSLVDAPHVASLLRRKREFEFALFHYACHTHTAQPRCFDLLHSTSTSIRILRINAPVTRLHHFPHGPDRACHIFRGRNRHASRKTITRMIDVYTRYKLLVCVENRGIVDSSLFWNVLAGFKVKTKSTLLLFIHKARSGRSKQVRTNTNKQCCTH